MEANTGDRIVIEGRMVRHPARVGRIVAVQGSGGKPPYLVRWSDSGEETVLYPGTDAHVKPASPIDREGDVRVLDRTARGDDGSSRLSADEIVALVRRHAETTTIPTAEVNRRLLRLWLEELLRLGPDARVGDVLELVLGRLSDRGGVHQPAMDG